jgi:Leucine-rich repeat (LRR) protein
MDIKILNREEALRYYENKEYREEINSKNQKISLDLIYYNNIIDLSKLSSVHTLNLKNCPKIRDVSNLSSVHTLNLSHCQNISSVYIYFTK